MPKINRLTKQMANLIAAGEVIDRPSSAVKELVENSVDAGATSITVEIRNGGISLIKVSDNGCGIEPDQAELAFMRFATSKIATEEDLFGIGTMGFRGEALASIAAVSNATLITSTGAGLGTKVVIEGGQILSHEESGCPKGTTILVRNLFFNTPARYKFLKKDSGEAASVQAVIIREALAHPEISFKLIRDGEISVSTPGDSNLFSTLYCIYGRELASGLMKVEYSSGDLSVSGYVSGPHAARKSRTMQYFFVNSRPVKNLMLQSALEEAMRQNMVSGHFPACFLSISVPLSQVDVNVHPAKTEVKFASEKNVFDLIYYGIRSAFSAGTQAEVPATVIGQDQSRRPEETVPDTDIKTEKKTVAESAEEKNPVREKPQKLFFGGFNPEPEQKKEWRSGPVAVRVTEDEEPDEPSSKIPDPEQTPVPDNKKASVETERRNAEEDAGKKVPQAEQEPSPSSLPPQEELSQTDPVPIVIRGEIFGVYIAAEVGETVYLIDKHAAHERIRYNELIGGAEVARQQFLSSAVVTLSPEEKELVLSTEDLASAAGFEFSDFGGTAISVNAVPDEYIHTDPTEAVSEYISCIKKDRMSFSEKKDKIMKMIACRSAIKAGDRMTLAEQEHLARLVLESDKVRTCPHGRPVFVKYTKTEIEKVFSRIV